MAAYYNEIDPFVAEWLRNLINANLIAPGDVDTRSIRDVRPDDLRSYTQCHFFAGIGVWSYALRRSGWEDDSSVWTGSCPCQPFSAAGKQAGTADDRHLWPAWFDLIRECRPAAVFGEQVASAIRHGWLDLVRTDLEGAGYVCGASVLGAHSAGAPHIRQRLWFVAHPTSAGHERWGAGEAGDGCDEARIEPERLCTAGIVAHSNPPERGSDMAGWNERNGTKARRNEGDRQSGEHCEAGLLAHSNNTRSQGRGRTQLLERTDQCASGEGMSSSNFWSDCDWLPCRDGKWRPTQPGLFPLAHGATKRVGRLRAYGNAIVAETAVMFIRACMDSIPQ